MLQEAPRCHTKRESCAAKTSENEEDGCRRLNKADEARRDETKRGHGNLIDGYTK
jgi:hypothetical protein